MAENEIPQWVKDQMAEQAAQREELIVTREEYEEAVNELVNLALTHDGSGARAAVQVVLSLYSSAYRCDLSDLNCMDYKYFKWSLIAIRGRVLLHEEPHTVIEDGNRKFDRLKEEWAGLWKRNED